MNYIGKVREALLIKVSKSMQQILIYFRCILLGTYYAELKALLICITHLNNLYLYVTYSVIQILLISLK